MAKRLKVWIEQAGADWDVKATIDDVVIYEESHLDEFAAQGDAEEFERELLGDLLGAAGVAAELAWRRVTELQERCTELLLALRDATNAATQWQLKAAHPVQMLLWCPECSWRHIDDGEFATKPHHTHACQNCGHVWRPALIPTVGVQYLPGFKGAPVRPTAEEHSAEP